jgi:hypothetical protein
VTEGQVLFDAISVGGADERGFSQRPTALGAFALEQMAFAGATPQYFSGAGDFESFRYGFSSLGSLGASHRGFFL